MTDHARTAPSARGGHALIVVGIVLLSFNMRPAAVTIGPVLGRIVDDLHLSGVEAGLTTPGMMIEIEADAVIHDEN